MIVYNTIFNWLPHVPGILDLIIAVGGVVLALITIHKYVFKPVAAKFKKVDRAVDSVLGYDAVLDPATGRVIQPPTPSMADRVKDLEDAQIRMADAMESIANTQKEMLVVSQKVVDLSVRFDAHEQESHKWQQDHEEWARGWMEEHSALHSVVKHESIEADD